MKERFSNYFTPILLIIICVNNSFAQPFQSKKSIYGYVGTSTLNVETKAVFDISGLNIPETNSTLTLENDLGMPASNTVLYLKFIAGGRFQVAGSYYSLHRTGEDYLQRDFAFGNHSYTVGAYVKGYFNTDYISGTLRFSILYNEKFTAGISLGGHYLKLKAGLDVDTNGISFVRDGSFNVPVIVPGIHGSFYLLPAVLFRGSLEYFKITLKNTSAKVIEGQISAEYFILTNLGAGVGYSYMDLRGEGLPDNDLYLRDVNYTLNGVNFFVACRF
jgi:hypothetical protein